MKEVAILESSSPRMKSVGKSLPKTVQNIFVVFDRHSCNLKCNPSKIQSRLLQKYQLCSFSDFLGRKFWFWKTTRFSSFVLGYSQRKTDAPKLPMIAAFKESSWWRNSLFWEKLPRYLSKISQWTKHYLPNNALWWSFRKMSLNCKLCGPTWPIGQWMVVV